jgi:acyl-CoA synthetase (AMP-forming)/AMP-acid ligase II
VLSAIAAEAARRFGDRPVVVAPDGVLTYSQLDEAADRLAAGLSHRGVAESDVVALVLPSGGDWLVAAVAADRLGAVFAGISTALAAPERAALVELVAPRLTLVDPSLVDGLPLRAEVAVLEPGSRGAAHMAPKGVTARHVDLHDEAPAVICFTSGTTGLPKAATFRVRQWRAVQRIDLGPDAEQRWDGGSPMLASTQFAHVGMSMKFPWYLRTGATLHVMERWRADDALRLVAEHRMPTIGVVAPQLALMLRSPLLDELDLDCVQAIIAGGAASPPTLVTEARRRLGAAYSIRYSSTESGGVGIATAFDAPDDEALHTVGRPRPGVEVRIADDEDRPLVDGSVGELQLRSGAMTTGYWNDAEATARAFSADGWLRTGDLARIDEHGRVVLAGRRTDMYIRGGYNVFPTEVEAVLGAHPGVADVVVVPRPDEVMGELGLALVVPVDDADPPTLESLRDHAAASLARHKLPERLLLTDELPLTSAQKLDRAAAAAHVAEREQQVQDGTAGADGIG